jgi:hypothetical protein
MLWSRMAIHHLVGNEKQSHCHSLVSTSNSLDSAHRTYQPPDPPFKQLVSSSLTSGGDAEWINVIDTTIDMYTRMSDAMRVVRETSLGTCYCQHRFEVRTFWMPVGCGGCGSLIIGRNGMGCGVCGVRVHLGCVLKGYRIACRTRDRVVG